jgi:repressor LexA
MAEHRINNVVSSLVSPTAPLTPKEKTVLEFLEMYARHNGYAPTYQEICKHFGFASFNSAQRYLKQLEAKEYISLGGGNQKRAISLLQSASAYQEEIEDRTSSSRRVDAKVESIADRSKANSSGELFQIPMLGRVAAGAPLEAYDHDEFIDVPASLMKNPDRTYALRVQGQSMIEDGIFEGDVILVQRQSQAENGEIVVAVVPSEVGTEEATVKRFYAKSRTSKKIELRPANSTMTSFWYDPGEVQIRGIVVGLIRRFW